jgi:uncharacterized repeat protein (TIGR01451 family)
MLRGIAMPASRHSARARRPARLVLVSLSIALALLVAVPGWPGGAQPAVAYAQQGAQPTPTLLPWLPGGAVDRRGGQTQRAQGGLVTRAETTAETIAYLNALRTLGGLPTLTENASWSAGAVLHSRYVVRTGTLVHDEVDSDPNRTQEGDDAGNNSNVAASGGLGVERDYIDGWLTAPFHGLHMVDPGWTSTGFGMYSKQAGDPSTQFQSAATLDVRRGLDNSVPLASPIMYPKSGGVTGYYTYPGGEIPDPLQTSTCLTKGFGSLAQTGMPIYLQIGGTPGAGVTMDDNPANTFIKRGGQSLEFCRITDKDGGGTMNFSVRNLVVLMPKDPLTAGTYDVSVRAQVGAGAFQTYAWSFTVAPPDLSVTSSHTGTFVPGTNATYTLTVQNAASASPTPRDLTLKDTLPAGLTLVSATGAGWDCQNFAPDVFCFSNLTLGPGASSTVTVTVAVGNVAPQTVNNVASIFVGTNSFTLAESALGNNTFTDPTVIGAPNACTTRPRVQVTTSAAGSGRIQVVVRAGQGQLQRMTLGAGARGVANALVDLPGGVQQGAGAVAVTPGGAGQATVGANATVSFTAPPAQYAFFVRRSAAGAATVPLVLTDGCGEWPSFVGMGAGVP